MMLNHWLTLNDGKPFDRDGQRRNESKKGTCTESDPRLGGLEILPGKQLEDFWFVFDFLLALFMILETWIIAVVARHKISGWGSEQIIPCLDIRYFPHRKIAHLKRTLDQKQLILDMDQPHMFNRWAAEASYVL